MDVPEATNSRRPGRVRIIPAYGSNCLTMFPADRSRGSGLNPWGYRDVASLARLERFFRGRLGGRLPVAECRQVLSFQTHSASESHRAAQNRRWPEFLFNNNSDGSGEIAG